MLFEDNGFLNGLERDAKRMKKEKKQFLRKEGTKYRRFALRLAKQRVGKVQTKSRAAGTYHKNIKRGKLYKNGDRIRIYTSDPIGHLVESGHKKKNGGRVAGKNVFADAETAFQSTFLKDCENFLDEVL